MIAKVLRRKRSTQRSRNSGFRTLINYTGQEHKIETTVLQNVMSEETAAVEMEAVAAQSARVSYAAYHLVISFAERDRPTPAQIERIVEAISEELGFVGHQVVARTHRDALQGHLHYVANRVHPDTYTIQQTPYDWNRLDRLCGRFERELGLTLTSRIGESRSFHVGDFLASMEPSKIDDHVRRGFTWTGKPSFQEWLGVAVGDVVYDAISRPQATWKKLKTALADYGLVVKKTGRGAVVMDPADPRYVARAGHIGRFATLPKLEAVLGELTDDFTPELRTDLSYHETVALVPADPPSPDLYAQFTRDRKDDQTRKKALRKDAWADQRRAENERRKAIRDEAKEARKRVRLAKKKRRATVPAMLAKIEADEADKLAELKLAIAAERARLRERLAHEARVISWRQWLVGQAKSGSMLALEAVLKERKRQRRMRNIFADPPELKAYRRDIDAPKHRVVTPTKTAVISTNRLDPRVGDGRIEPLTPDAIPLVGITDPTILEPLRPSYIARDARGSYAAIVQAPAIRDSAQSVVDTLRSAGAGNVRVGPVPYPGATEMLPTTRQRVRTLAPALAVVRARQTYGAKVDLVPRDRAIVGRALKPIDALWQGVETRDGVFLAPADARLTGTLVTYNLAQERLVACPPERSLDLT
jgi:uncharacterized protein with PIN domain